MPSGFYNHRIKTPELKGRLCWCGKELIRRPDESRHFFNKRKTCDKKCDTMKRKTERIGWHTKGMFDYLFQ